MVLRERWAGPHDREPGATSPKMDEIPVLRAQERATHSTYSTYRPAARHRHGVIQLSECCR